MNNRKIAWRNLWRNKRRALITAASIFFSVFLAIVMRSMQEGSYTSMIDNMVKFYSGYIQIQNEAYWENKTINNTFESTTELMDKINSVKEITNYTYRLETFSLASSDSITQGGMVIGVEPEKENEVTGLKKWINEDGEYLKPGDNGVMIGETLAKHLKIGIGDTLVIIGQGYHGVGAAGKYPVKALLEFPTPELSKSAIYMDITQAQELYSAPERYTSLVLMIEDHLGLEKADNELKDKIGSPYKVINWQEMQPELVQMIESDRGGGLLMIAILYIVIAFGIFGTLMMLMAERKREFGVMIAVGMRKLKLTAIVIYEVIYMGLLGVLAGTLFSLPIVIAFYFNPIPLSGDAAQMMIDMGIEPVMFFSIEPYIFYNQALLILLIMAVVAIYPVSTIKRLKVIGALRA
ncbi:MAG: ABC transporter permease [Bacteroidota bacterium]